MDKPEVIDEYNCNMSGIDRCDQMVSYYSTPRKTLRWYFKVFFHFVDLSMWNANYLYNKENAKMSYIDFRNRVIKDLLQLSLAARPSPSTSTPSAKQHYPEKVVTRKRCRVCYAIKKSVRTFYVCTICRDKKKNTIGLCAGKCFQIFHEKKKCM